MWIKPIPKSSLVATVANRVRELIESGKLASGDRIPSEPDLAAQLHVSRTVLREAISGLQSMGILEVRRGLGTFVGSCEGLSVSAKLLQSALTISPRDLRATLEFRRGIEQQAARRATEKATPEDLQELSKLCDDMDRYDSDSVESMRADFSFHQKIVDMTGNELMKSVMALLYESILTANLRMSLAEQSRKRGAVHRLILEAIRSRNPDAAELAMREHMDQIERRLN